MIQHQEAEHLDPWLRACAESGISGLVTFGEGLQKDYAAIRAALELPWSSGQAEGQIDCLKMLKCQMYGRASFDLLRSRVLPESPALAPCTAACSQSSEVREIHQSGSTPGGNLG